MLSIAQPHNSLNRAEQKQGKGNPFGELDRSVHANGHSFVYFSFLVSQDSLSVKFVFDCEQVRFCEANRTIEHLLAKCQDRTGKYLA